MRDVAAVVRESCKPKALRVLMIKEKHREVSGAAEHATVQKRLWRG